MQTKTTDSRDDLKRAISSKTDEELYEILGTHFGNYTSETIEIAKEEFTRRNLDQLRLTKVKVAAQESHWTMEHKWSFTGYWFSPEKVFNLPLIEMREIGGKEEEYPTTVGDFYKKQRDGRVELDDHVLDLKAKTETETLTVKGPRFNRELLSLFFGLWKEGVNPFSTIWFYYDHDVCLKDAQESFSFFVVANEKIVREDVSFPNFWKSGFDPSIFEKDDIEPIWQHDKAWSTAKDLYWYRKFCHETRTGQIVALRGDKPKLMEHLNRALSIETAIASQPDSSMAPLLSSVLTELRIVRWILVLMGAYVLYRLLR